MEPTEFKYTYNAIINPVLPLVSVSVGNNVGYPRVSRDYRFEESVPPSERRERALAMVREEFETQGYYDSRNNITYEPEGTPIPEGFMNAPRDITITGRVASAENNKPLANVTVEYGGIRVQTDRRGSFRMEFEFTPGDEIGDLVFTKQGFGEARVFPANQDNTFKPVVAITKLAPVEENLVDLEAQVIADGIENQVDELKSLNPANAKQVLIRKINQAGQRLYTRIVPAIIVLISRFGVKVVKNQLTSSAAQSCPPFRDLRRIIRKRNRLTRSLNRLYRTVRSITRAVTGLRNIIRVISVLFRILRNLPLPTAIIPPVTGGIGIPMSLVQSIDDKKDKIEREIEGVERISSVVLAVLALLGSAIRQALDLLSGLDAMSQQCIDNARRTVVETLAFEAQNNTNSIITGSGGDGFGDGNIGIGVGSNGVNIRDGINVDDAMLNGGAGIDYSTIPNLNDILGTDNLSNDEIADLLSGNYFQEQLDNDLTELRGILENEQGADSSPREVNGFILEVQTDPRYEVGRINRRFAVGKNRDGIVLIQGDPSFASSDQILIDELAFFIEQNDLKPN